MSQDARRLKKALVTFAASAEPGSQEGRGEKLRRQAAAGLCAHPVCVVVEEIDIAAFVATVRPAAMATTPRAFGRSAPSSVRLIPARSLRRATLFNGAFVCFVVGVILRVRTQRRGRNRRGPNMRYRSK